VKQSRDEREGIAVVEVSTYMHGRPSWTELAHADPEAGLSFYSTVFGWGHTEIGTGADRYVLFTKGGKHVAAMRGMPQDGPARWTTYFNVDDADAVTAKVKAAGGTVVVDPTTVATAGRMALFLDPNGAEFAVWQPGDHIGAQLLNEPGTYISSELGAADAAASKPFYAQVFDWEWIALDDYAEAAVDGVYVAGLMPAESFPRFGRPTAPDYWLTCFASDAVDDLVDTAVGLGATVLCPPYTNLHGKRYAILADPENAPFALYDY
jgi:predicted enzyme related to lactoylglutathione lyase